MKKILSLILAIVLLFSLAACDAKEDIENTQPTKNDTTAPLTESTEPQTEPSETEKETVPAPTNPKEEDIDTILTSDKIADFRTGFESLELIDFTKYDSFAKADVNAKELNEIIKEKINYDTPNFMNYTAVNLSSAYTYNGKDTSVEIEAYTYFATADNKSYGLTHFNSKSTEMQDGNMLLDAEFYLDNISDEIYAQANFNGEKQEWTYAKNGSIMLSTLMVTTGGEGLTEELDVKDDGDGHYVIKVVAAERLAGLLGSIGEVRDDTEFFYVIEKDFSAIRMYMDNAKFNDSRYDQDVTKSESDVDVFVAIYDIGKVGLETVTPVEDALESKDEIQDQNQPSGESKVFVQDHAELLSEAEENLLIDTFTDRFKDSGYYILFVTTNDAEGKTTQEWVVNYANNYFPTHDNNITFAIDMDNRVYYIDTMGLAVDNITDHEVELILDAGESHIAESKYAHCLYAMAEKTVDCIK